jgi:serine/threonine protein kinase
LAASERGETQPAVVEFNNQKAICDLPDPYIKAHVVPAYSLFKCPNYVAQSEFTSNNHRRHKDIERQAIIVMGYATGGSLRNWLAKMAAARPTRLNDEVMSVMIYQILRTLYKISLARPDFRHNDLHLENVFVKEGKKYPTFQLGDFGWSRITKNGTNPAVNTVKPANQLAGVYGVGPETDARYDMHFFLNELLSWTKRHTGDARDGFRRTIPFLERMVPVGFRGQKSEHVIESRLKYRDPCIGLPGLRRALNDAFIKQVDSAFMNAKTPPRVASPPKPRFVARPRSASPKRTYTNAQLLNLPGAQFMKLSPASRARAAKLRLERRGPATPARRNSPPKPAPKRNSPPKPAPKRNSPPKPPRPSPRRATPRRNFQVKLSPKSGRAKIMVPGKKRHVYANLQTLNFLERVAANYGINTAGVRRKNNMAVKIFGRKQ